MRRPLLLAAGLALAMVAAASAGAQGESGQPHDHEHGHGHGQEHGHAAAPQAAAGETVWEPAGGPLRLAHLDVGFTDQDGASGTLAELVDRPVLVTFFYSRCQNSRKCPLTVSRLAGLQRRLEAAGLGEQVRLLAITYEPQFDTPERLARYATSRGLLLGPTARALRLDPERQQAVVDDLAVDVAYNSGWVSGHGVELSLLDAEGRLVRKYHSMLWHDPRVVDDVRRLLAGGG